jgi:hypothetical protein
MSILSVAMEAIRFQTNSKLGESIESAIKLIRGSDSVTDRTVSNSGLEKAILDTTGLDIEVVLANGEFGDIENFAAIAVTDIDRNNPVLNDWRQAYATGKDGFKELSKRDNVIKGEVDLVNAKVSGDFTKFKSTLYLSRDVISKGSRFTVKEITAIILHEIGHKFSYMEALGRSVRTNHVLMTAAKELIGTSDAQKKYEILDEVEAFTKSKITDRNTILQANEPMAITTVLLSESMIAMRSELGCNIYDYRGFEQLADQFATRMGYGADIVSALDKLFRLYGDKAYYGRIGFSLMEVFKLTLFVVGTAATIMLATLAPVMAMLYASMGVLMLSMNPLLDEYDNPKRRFEVIRNEIQKALKNTKLPKADKQRYLENLECIENVLINMNDHKPLYEWVWRNIYPWGRKQAKAIDVQKALEDLANTRLYAVSAKLDLLV